MGQGIEWTFVQFVSGDYKSFMAKSDLRLLD